MAETKKGKKISEVQQGMENPNPASGKEDTLVVSKSALERLLKVVEEQGEQLKRLEGVADVSRLSAYDGKRKVIGPRRYKLSRIDGKVVTGWRTIKDEVWKDGNVTRVDQRYEVIFEDNTKREIAGYNNFADAQYKDQFVCELVSKKTDDSGTVFTLKDIQTGKEYIIDSRFVN